MRLYLLVGLAAIGLGGCMQPLPPASLLAAADARARPPALRAGNAASGIVSFRPVGPRGWDDAPPSGTPSVKGAKP